MERDITTVTPPEEPDITHAAIREVEEASAAPQSWTGTTCTTAATRSPHRSAVTSRRACASYRRRRGVPGRGQSAVRPPPARPARRVDRLPGGPAHRHPLLAGAPSSVPLYRQWAGREGERPARGPPPEEPGHARERGDQRGPEALAHAAPQRRRGPLLAPASRAVPPCRLIPGLLRANEYSVLSSSSTPNQTADAMLHMCGRREQNSCRQIALRDAHRCLVA